MNPDEIRIAIATAYGFTDIRMSSRWEVSDPPDDPHVLCGIITGTKQQIPDYLNDLNEIRHAVALFVEREGFPFQRRYTAALREVIARRRKDLNQIQMVFWVAEASAAQRSEALLVAIGKREDDK